MKHFDAKPAAKEILRAWAVRGVGNTEVMIHGVDAAPGRVVVVFANEVQGRREIRLPMNALPASLLRLTDFGLRGFRGPVVVDHEAMRCILVGLLEEINELHDRLLEKAHFAPQAKSGQSSDAPLP